MTNESSGEKCEKLIVQFKLKSVLTTLAGFSVDYKLSILIKSICSLNSVSQAGGKNMGDDGMRTGPFGVGAFMKYSTAISRS